MKKELIKISFGSKPGNESMPEGSNPENMEGEEPGEDHVSILTEIKEKVMQIPGTERIVQAIDEFLKTKAQGGSYEDQENKEEGVFKGFSDYFSKKMGGK